MYEKKHDISIVGNDKNTRIIKHIIKENKMSIRFKEYGMTIIIHIK